MISRAERLGPRFADGLGAADAALFSRGKNVLRSEQMDKAYSAGMTLGPGAALTESQHIVAAAHRRDTQRQMRRRRDTERQIDWRALADARARGD